MAFTADFETTTNVDDCRVWLWGAMDIETEEFIWGNNIRDFIGFCYRNSGQTFYFHNLKFDSEFLLYYLFENGYTYVEDRKDFIDKSFTMMIDGKNIVYSLEICFSVRGKRKRKVKILDSLKILPYSVKEIAKAFGTPFYKLDMDYKKFREIGYMPTEEEVKYLEHDLKIPAFALKTLFNQNLKAMTTGGNAIKDFKDIIGKKRFEYLFPIPDYDSDIRQSYKGGWTYCLDKYKSKDVKSGIVFDVNSLYPSVMYNKHLPVGEGIYFTGEYEEDKNYNLFIQMFKCQFELKENHLPTIQIKSYQSRFNPTEYLSSSNGEDVTLCLTSIDLKLFLEQYEVTNIEYISGWKFRSSNIIFRDYIDKWNKVKIEAGKTKNKGMRTLAKLMLNSLYGKFALSPQVFNKHPYYEDGRVKYRMGEAQERDPIYIPIASFITSYAREITIRSGQSVYDRFIYADTDSLHLTGTEIPKELDIDEYRLGAWKVEYKFIRGRFIRAKSYIEEMEISIDEKEEIIENDPTHINLIREEKGKLYYTKITCAGMPSGCYKNVTWSNFKLGTTYSGKLQQSRVKGGIVLIDNEFTLRA